MVRQLHPSKLLLAGSVLGATLALSGCSAETSAQWARFGLPEAASDRAPFIGDLWVGAWIASLVVGVFVWGLIVWVMIRYRRRQPDEQPRQTRYNLPMELLYTLVPFLIIGVLFFYTVQAQNGVIAKETVKPVTTVNVIGQKWSWTFNYMEAANPAVGADVPEGDRNRLLNRETIVIILSDGWDTDQPELLADAMQRIQQKSRKVIWLNPLAGFSDYQPRTSAMEVALPYVDVFASAHSVESLRALGRWL